MIRAAVRLGALSAGDKGRRALPVLDKYAESIGLAFQVQDDILYVVGDTATLGKRQGADQQLGKSTYPALLGLEQARKKARDLIDDARQSRIGLAFQVQDDILDVVGDTATLGKRQGADQQLGKSTYPALLGLEQAR